MTPTPFSVRLRINEHKLDLIASLKDMRRAAGMFGPWAGLAPDDSPLLLRDTSAQQIYVFGSLNLNWIGRDVIADQTHGSLPVVHQFFLLVLNDFATKATLLLLFFGGGGAATRTLW
jgi:hypothetical protein